MLNEIDVRKVGLNILHTHGTHCSGILATAFLLTVSHALTVS